MLYRSFQHILLINKKYGSRYHHRTLKTSSRHVQSVFEVDTAYRTGNDSRVMLGLIDNLKAQTRS